MQPSIVVIDNPIYPEVITVGERLPWVMPGRYTVEREFDKDRYIIRLNEKTITLVKKSLTRVFA